MAADGIAVEIGNVYVVVGFPDRIPKRRGRRIGEPAELQPYVYSLNAETFEKFGGATLAHVRGWPYATFVYGAFLRVVELVANRVPAAMRGRTVIQDGPRLRAWRDEEIAGELCLPIELWRSAAEDLVRMRKLRREMFTLRLPPAEAEQYRSSEPFEQAAPLFWASGCDESFFLRAIAPTKLNTELSAEEKQNTTPDRLSRPATPAGELTAATPATHSVAATPVGRTETPAASIAAASPASVSMAARTGKNRWECDAAELADAAALSHEADALWIAIARSMEKNAEGPASWQFTRLILTRLCPDGYTEREAAAVRRAFGAAWANNLGAASRLRAIRELWHSAVSVAADARNRSPIAVWIAVISRRKPEIR